MSYPMIAWCVIVGVLLCAFLFRAVVWYCSEYRNRGRRLRPFFEIGKERDIFYIPGDEDILGEDD